MRRLVSSLLIVVGLIFVPHVVLADEVFILKGGGQVVGELLNPKQVPRKTYVIKTPTGGQITLARSQVQQTVHRRDVIVEYERIRPRYADTVEGQWALAEWCREHRLSSLRDDHLERIIELDPDHEEARRGLGYFRRDGEWTTRDQLKQEAGYVWYKGKYRLPQEVQLMKEEKAADQAEGEWLKKLKLWRGWLFTSRYHDRARDAIRQIDSPHAVKALASALEDDRRDQARILYVEALARIGTPAAQLALAARSLRDPVEEVSLTCLDYLKEQKSPAVVNYFIGRLRSKSNGEVNRAGVALGHLGDPSAVGPLIDALVTKHQFKVTVGNPGRTGATFDSTGSSGLTVGGGTKIVTLPLNNRGVLDALVTLTGGVNYGFDVPRWKAWYAIQKRTHQDLDARRD